MGTLRILGIGFNIITLEEFLQSMVFLVKVYLEVGVYGGNLLFYGGYLFLQGFLGLRAGGRHGGGLSSI